MSTIGRLRLPKQGKEYAPPHVCALGAMGGGQPDRSADVSESAVTMPVQGLQSASIFERKKPATVSADSHVGP
jgi:hypothetical protein